MCRNTLFLKVIMSCIILRCTFCSLQGRVHDYCITIKIQIKFLIWLRKGACLVEINKNIVIILHEINLHQVSKTSSSLMFPLHHIYFH